MGFMFLGLAIGALQMMLDRGELLDWFGSTEIIAEAVIAGLAFYLFVVHMFTHRAPFLEPRLFQDRNFVVGTSFMFAVGIILLATMTLLPPMLQQLAGFPVLTTGYVLAPRGIGTMIAMFVVGRLVGRIDPRLLLMSGLFLAAFSLWEMTQFNIDVGVWDIVRTGIVQGAGLGLIFVPLSAITFSTLPADLRTEAAGLFSLMRNIGSSVGISIVTALLTRGTQINHAQLAEQVTPYMDALKAPGYPTLWSPDTGERARRAERRADAPGADDRLSRRLPVADVGDPGGAAADPAVAQEPAAGSQGSDGSGGRVAFSCTLVRLRSTRDLTQAFKKAAVVALPRRKFCCVGMGGAIEP